MGEVVEAVLEECRKSLPDVAWQWSTPVREAIERLVGMCRDERVGDEEFLRQVESTARALPELLPRLDTQALAEELEAAMLAVALLPTEVRGKAPQELVVIDAARRCGRSFIPEWKRCRKDNPPEKKELLKLYASEKQRVKNPLSREVVFGKRLASHFAKSNDDGRHRFNDVAIKTVEAPDEIWEDGTRYRYVKKQIKESSKLGFGVVTHRIAENLETAITYIPQRIRDLKKMRLGKQVYPARDQSGYEHHTP